MNLRRSIGVASFLVSLLGAGAAPALATPIINNTGLVSPSLVITFSEFVFDEGTPITNQFSSLGVTFGPSMFYDVQPFFFPTPDLANFDVDFSANNPISVFFSSPVSAAAVAIQTNPGTATFTALRLGVVVESFSAATDLSELPDLTHASDFFGFSGIVFDELRIDSTGEFPFFQMDNLQYTVSAVPEPATFLLLGTGLAAVAARRLKRRS